MHIVEVLSRDSYKLVVLRQEEGEDRLRHITLYVCHIGSGVYLYMRMKRFITNEMGTDKSREREREKQKEERQEKDIKITTPT